tara:strand:- start:6955 stop:7275 length:321 start_codon:yes stop_codon:yes gene_type:complete
MAKWKLTDASAKRIMAAYVSDLPNGGDRYLKLRKAVNAEGQEGFNAMGEMLRWISDNAPKYLVGLADDVSYLYETLREKTRAYLKSFDALSNHGEYKHYHHHSDDE